MTKHANTRIIFKISPWCIMCLVSHDNKNHVLVLYFVLVLSPPMSCHIPCYLIVFTCFVFIHDSFDFTKLHWFIVSSDPVGKVFFCFCAIRAKPWHHLSQAEWSQRRMLSRGTSPSTGLALIWRRARVAGTNITIHFEPRLQLILTQLRINLKIFQVSFIYI